MTISGVNVSARCLLVLAAVLASLSLEPSRVGAQGHQWNDCGTSRHVASADVRVQIYRVSVAPTGGMTCTEARSVLDRFMRSDISPNADGPVGGGWTCGWATRPPPENRVDCRSGAKVLQAFGAGFEDFIREGDHARCGNYGRRASGNLPATSTGITWTFDPINGPGIRGLIARRFSCAIARGMARTILTTTGRRSFTYKNYWKCRVRPISRTESTYRCATRSGKVTRWRRML
jgi:hypothetical protein